MTDKIPEDFSAIDPAKVREMEVRNNFDCWWLPRSVMLIKNGGARDTDGKWWEQCREIPSKKMRPMTQREIMDFCVEKRPEVRFDGSEFIPFWAWSFKDDVHRYVYRLADGTEGKFEVEE